MSKNVFVLDSFALMAYFQEERGAAAVQGFIKKAQHKDCVLKLSAMNWGEIYYNIVRSKGPVAGQEYLILMERFPIEVVDIDRGMIMEAASWKARCAMSYADCFAAALAQREGAAVITGDKEFHQIAHEIPIHWI